MGLFAAGHFGGFLQACYVARHEPGMAELTAAMRAQKANVLGFEPSILDFREYFSLNFSVLLASCAAIGWASVRDLGLASATLFRLSLVYVFAMLGLVGTSIFFSVPQGMISASFIATLFAIAAIRLRQLRGSAA